MSKKRYESVAIAPCRYFNASKLAIARRWARWAVALAAGCSEATFRRSLPGTRRVNLRDSPGPNDYHASSRPAHSEAVISSDSHALRTSGRATQFTYRFQTTARLGGSFTARQGGFRYIRTRFYSAPGNFGLTKSDMSTFGLLVGYHPGWLHSQVVDVTAQGFAMP